MRTLPPTHLRQSLSEQEYTPLLRSLGDGAAGVAINMALLTELSGLSPPLDRVKDACKVQRARAQLAPVCQGCCGVSTSDLLGHIAAPEDGRTPALPHIAMAVSRCARRPGAHLDRTTRAVD